MPYRVGWWVQDRVIYASLVGNVTAKDTIAMFEEIIRLLDATGGADQIHVVGDARPLLSSVTKLMQIMEVTRSYFAHPQLGLTVQISQVPLYNYLAKTSASILRKPLLLAATPEEAQKILLMEDETLAPNTQWHTITDLPVMQIE